VETIHAYAREISLTPTADSPFAQKWEQAVARYFRGDYAGAARSVDEAERIMPGFADLMRLRIDAGMRGEGGAAFSTGWLLSSVGVALALLAVSGWRLARRRTRRASGGVRRISPHDVRDRLAAGSDVTLVDARQGSVSRAEAAGSPALQVQVTPNGEAIVYCD
jgi:hypothetical protein